MTDTSRPFRTLHDLTGPEARTLDMLRLWPLGPEAQAHVWATLAAELGPARARDCLSAFEALSAHLARSAWTAPRIAPPEAVTLTADEDALCRIVDSAARGGREEALAHASFVLRPDALLPFLHAAERTGLPLLCAECRARLLMCHSRTH
ncbi:hypothetical protein ROJ8625_00636 [Roseivivax jejudonensis]|uniref:Uncharacterized protein n=1 Tax=Roseivivax jejudonensis TaxID=1529041 RepID=A0A1X6YDW7_9RHOB|nr:hypothetical protein [Roseivivax jejudonensis]SLN18584.1 hypothetical protein ROJ8625_00636 [Roseivivax jejudonensis]